MFLSEPLEEDELPAGSSLTDKVRLLEAREIRKALRETGGVKSRAARALGVTERILGYKIRTYGLDDPA
jgi:transcriptional regulator with GAF, ATPase, and Fis domain